MNNLLFLFIFESIGTSELILIGIIALIFLGPRKLPEIARKMGKIMADFRNTTSEFKETWEREVNFEAEEVAIRTGELPDAQVPRISPTPSAQTEGIAAPEIKAIDASAFTAADVHDTNNPADSDTVADKVPQIENSQPSAENDESLEEKRNWL